MFVLFGELELTDINIYFVAQTAPDSVIGRTMEVATVGVGPCACLSVRSCLCACVCLTRLILFKRSHEP